MRVKFVLAILVATSLAIPWSTIEGRTDCQKAIYFLDDGNGTESRIVAMPIMSNGLLGKPTLKSTKGKGGIPISTLATPAGIFFSDSSVTVGGNYLFTVNSASNTVAMFAIPEDDPTNLMLVDVADSMGEFPMSVAFSEPLQMVCVLNGAGQGGVACYHVTNKGFIPDGSLRPLGLNQTTPPTGPSNSATQIAFNPSSTALWVIIKGDPTTKPIMPGSFVEYPVISGMVGMSGKTSQVDDIVLNFGTSFISDSEFLIAAPILGGGALVEIVDGVAKQSSKIAVEGQLAICWSAYNAYSGKGYLLDAGRTYVTVVDVATGKQLPPIMAATPGNNGTQGGLYDTAILDNYSYSLADPNGVVVLDLEANKQVQYFDLKPYGVRINFEGMATWPNY